MFNEKLFKQQLKEWKKENNENDIKTKYEVLDTIELFNKENIYNINMIVNSAEEAIDFVDRVENPDQVWKTLTDVIVDVRREKLEQVELMNENYIERLVEEESYINLHTELERVFMQHILFTMVKKFVLKVEKLGVGKVIEIVNTHRGRGLSTVICYM